MFISFEGCDGCGKSTQVKYAIDFLESRGHGVLLTREPGGDPLSEKIRGIILDAAHEDMQAGTEALLYAAARVQHVNSLILPAVKAGKVVVCDRFVDSSFAYQGVARGLGFDYIRTVFELTCGVYPDITVWLDVPSDDAFLRKGGADKADRMELAGSAFHKSVYDGYIQAQLAFPNRILRVDASGGKADTRQKVQDALISRGL